jgi:hypothetical protein
MSDDDDSDQADSRNADLYTPASERRSESPLSSLDSSSIAAMTIQTRSGQIPLEPANKEEVSRFLI